jgi:hypothetical protein
LNTFPFCLASLHGKVGIGAKCDMMVEFVSVVAMLFVDGHFLS